MTGTPFNSFNCLTNNLLLGDHIIGTSVFKVLLTNSLPVATNTIKSNITEISAANGYSAGGPTTTVTQAAGTGTTTIVKASNVTVTATGAVGPFRYAVLYNSTNSALLGWVDCGQTTMAVTDTLVVSFDQTNGVLAVG